MHESAGQVVDSDVALLTSTFLRVIIPIEKSETYSTISLNCDILTTSSFLSWCKRGALTKIFTRFASHLSF